MVDPSASTTPRCRPTTLLEAAVQILLTADPFEKAAMTSRVAADWRSGELATAYQVDGDDPSPPDKPARDGRVTTVPSGKTAKLGKGGTLASRQAIIHSLTHIESWAVDLSWDIIARFGGKRAMPRQFFDDFVTVAEEEAKHFTLLNTRLEAMGSEYGALTAHDGLWESAWETADSLEARLAVEHCVHEARGLDILPQTVARLRAAGDEDSANLLWDVIYVEEITHCAAGLKWFIYLHDGAAHEQVVHSFHQVVSSHFYGNLKPPFNDEARAIAGFDKEWYMPLVDKPLGRRPSPAAEEASRGDGGSHKEPTLPADIEAR